jgi:transcriptional regulator with XRE-family HTH domain
MILRYMRQTRKLSLNQAGEAVGISGSAIAHIEQGRMDVSRARLQTLLEAYRFTEDEYLEFFDGRPVPLSMRDECIGIVRDLDDSRLHAVHSMLINLMPPGSARHAGSPTQNAHKSPAVAPRVR